MSPDGSFIPNPNQDRLLPPADFERQGKSSAGPIVGIVIIIILLIVGALYFWGAHLNNEARQSAVPYIPSSTSTITILSTTTAQ